MRGDAGRTAVGLPAAALQQIIFNQARLEHRQQEEDHTKSILICGCCYQSASVDQHNVLLNTGDSICSPRRSDSSWQENMTTNKLKKKKKI